MSTLTSNPLYSPTKAAREWAQRRGRADDAMLIEAWTTGWNSRCIPEEPGALADHLRSMLLDGTVQCPLCGKTGPHPHSPEEIVIYRNGVKYGRSLKSASDETGALPHASAALKAFMAELGETMSMEDGATPADYLQRARDIREWCHDHQTCAACLEAQSLITDFDSEIPDGDMPDRLGDLLPKLKSTADAVDMVRTATLLHKRNCECEACYWIGRSPLAQRQAHAQKAGEGQS